MKQVRKTKNFIRRFRKNGLKAFSFHKQGQPIITQKNMTLEYFNFIMDDVEIPFDEAKYKLCKDGEKTINWIIPCMGVGSGGHINIFRFINNLQKRGLKNRVYLFGGSSFDNSKQLIAFLDENYNLNTKEVEIHNDTKNISFAHATVATSWSTAYYVRKFNNTISKFYFVQDFEPYFYAKGSEYMFAENTYRFGFRGLTAGDWLKDVVTNQYHMKADSFGFSYDKDLYQPKQKRDDVKRIMFYARPVTPRRDFELGLLALNDLAKHVEGLEVAFAGWDVSNYYIPFKHANLGSVKLEELSDLYAQCDMCLILSNTNLSLLPLEVMASNSVAVCSKGENSSWLVNESNSIMVDLDPIQISRTLQYYFEHPDELEQIKNNGREFALQTSWEKEAEKVYQAILKGISEDEK